jgi:hypothetical protein
MQQAALNPDSVNVENVKKGERAVAMDLGLGVYDAPGAAEGGMEGKGFGPVVDSDLTAVQSKDEDDDEDEDEEMDGSDEEEEDTSDSSSSDTSADGDDVENTSNVGN